MNCQYILKYEYLAQYCLETHNDHLHLFLMLSHFQKSKISLKCLHNQKAINKILLVVADGYAWLHWPIKCIFFFLVTFDMPKCFMQTKVNVFKIYLPRCQSNEQKSDLSWERENLWNIMISWEPLVLLCDLVSNVSWIASTFWNVNIYHSVARRPIVMSFTFS